MHNLHVIDGIGTATLSDFITLAETRSFQTTANRQHISQPALSRRIQALEEAIGAKLFDRRSQPISLTKAGSAVLPFVKEALGRLAEGLEAFRTVSSGLRDPIRIVATHTAAITTLPEWLSRCGLSLDQDQILLNSFRTERCFSELRAGRADLALCMWPTSEPPPEDLLSVILKNDFLIAVQARGLKAAGSIQFLSFSTGGALGEALQKTLSKLGAKTKLNTVFESPSSEVLLSMATAGFGVAYLPASLCAKSRGLTKLPWPKLAVEMRLFRTQEVLGDRIEGIWVRSDRKIA